MSAMSAKLDAAPTPPEPVDTLDLDDATLFRELDAIGREFESAGRLRELDVIARAQVAVADRMADRAGGRITATIQAMVDAAESVGDQWRVQDRGNARIGARMRQYFPVEDEA